MNINLSAVMQFLGMEKACVGKAHNEMDIIALIDKGVTKGALLHLSRSLSMTMRQIATLLPVTERTLQRYKPNQHLSPEISEHIISIAEVGVKGMSVFKDKESFLSWLNTQNKAIDNKKPVTLLNTRYGAQLVSDMLTRIEYGVFS